MRPQTTSWIDLHTHINMIKQAPELILQRAKNQGVEKMVLIGTDPEDIFVVSALAKQYSESLICAVGIHPHDAKNYADKVEADLKQLAGGKEVIGIGEIGLDFYYDNSPREKQKEVFRRQMDLAVELGLPVEIHTRDAEKDTVEILKEYKGRAVGVLHCFTGTHWLAHQALDLGWDISLSGVCTFKNAEELRNTIKTLPKERIHIETDAPFMTPVPNRGKENEPSFVIHTAQVVAQLLGLSVEQLSVQLKLNAKRLFPKLIWP